jgi:hypothetical protein
VRDKNSRIMHVSRKSKRRRRRIKKKKNTPVRISFGYSRHYVV